MIVDTWSPTELLSCPACLSWQIDYTYDVAVSYSIPRFMDGVFSFDSRPFWAFLESEVERHLGQCADWFTWKEPRP